MSREASTLLIARAGSLEVFKAPRFSLVVERGADEGLQVDSVDGTITVGTADRVDLRLTDPTVSRYHAELTATAEGIAVRDLGSTNGTVVGGALVREVVLRDEMSVRFGKTKTRLRLAGAHEEVRTSDRVSFGALIGASVAMRQVYALLERAAPTSAPVLVMGESGTGKELVARAVHDASDRRDGPFEVVDCGGLPATLIESELFGHVRGAFTSASSDHVGAFERADGGTLFLDELGELPLELQPKLLRVLGAQEVRRLGARDLRKVDVRVVAATNRDLRREVNAGTFRADLFYRLAVIQVHMPPLRERPDDLRPLVRTLLERIAHERVLDAVIEPDEDLFAALARHHWPGNVRELRNYLEQLLILRVPPNLPVVGVAPATGSRGVVGEALGELARLPLRSAKQRLIEQFERAYVERLLEDTEGNVAEAARRAGVDRGTLFRTIRRYGIDVER